jgi:hypothetical protein
MRILSCTVTREWTQPGENVLRLSNGGQNADLLPHAIDGEPVWMELLSDSLEVTLMSRNPNAPEFGFAEVRLTDICKYENVLHKVNVYASIKDRARGWLEKDAALVILELFYGPRFAGGMLVMEVVAADLLRNTEVVGKMDPYVVIRYGGKDSKTSVKSNAGKKPQWFERFSFPVSEINGRMELRVMDRDFTKDDEVGRASFSLRELGLLSARETPRTLELVYSKNGKNPEPAGVLHIKTQFTM